MIDYQWTVVQMECYPELDGQTDVVFMVHWRVNGQKEYNGKMYSSGNYGTVNLPFEDYPGFTPYDQLTQEQVLTWVWDNMGPEQVAAIEEGIAKAIDNLINPPILTLPLPWIPPAPVSDFTADPLSGDGPLTVTFTDTSTNNPTSWAWDFTNSGNVDSIEQNPTFTYQTAGTYSVRLTVGNSGGTNSTLKNNLVTVTTPLPGPTANFSAIPESGTTPLTVNFQDTSMNNPTSWAWDFTNSGNIDSTEQNPSYEYANAGTYTVKLTVTNSVGSDTITKTDYITVTDSE